MIIKKGGSDPDAFKEPLRFECIWSIFPPGKHKWSVQKGIGTGLILSPFKNIAEKVNVVEDEVPESGSFWRAIPPPGYTALGDVALRIDGIVPDDNGTKPTVLQSHMVPKYVCIKDEYLSRFRELEVDGIMKDTPNKVGFPSRKQSVMENKVRNRLWSSERSPGSLLVHGAIYEQETVTRDILSPMVCKRGLIAPKPEELSPTLDIDQIVEALPYWIVIKSGLLRKKGIGMVAQSHIRFFVLTNEKKLYYYGDTECKGYVNLMKMRQCGTESETKFWIDTKERKYELEVVDEESTGSTATDWVQKIRYVKSMAKIGGYDELEIASPSSESDGGFNSSSALAIEEKESEQQKIVKFSFVIL